MLINLTILADYLECHSHGASLLLMQRARSLEKLYGLSSIGTHDRQTNASRVVAPFLLVSKLLMVIVLIFLMSVM